MKKVFFMTTMMFMSVIAIADAHLTFDPNDDAPAVLINDVPTGVTPNITESPDAKSHGYNYPSSAITAENRGDPSDGADMAALASNYHRWYCIAESQVAEGYGYDYPTRASAARRALNECAVRTPYTMVCRITECGPHR